MENRFYTIEQVAEALDIHHKTVRKFIKEGKLKANKLGKQWRILDEDLEEFTKGKDSVVKKQQIDNNDEIKISEGNINAKQSNEIKVSSVVELREIDKEEYSRISNMLLAMMNCKNERTSNYTVNIKYNDNENRLMIMIWAGLELTKEILDVISILTKNENMELKNKGE